MSKMRMFPPGQGPARTGTREWSDASANGMNGCAHGCLYCYGRQRALWTGGLGDGADWTNEVYAPSRAAAAIRRVLTGGRIVMFPTEHDLTPANLEYCLPIMGKILGSENRLLIVTKAHESCVRQTCKSLSGWRDHVEFRFTIGAASDEVLSFWEPGAPPFAERMAALRHAHEAGYITSLSSEPLLARTEILAVLEQIAPYVSGTIWIGACNHLRQRTAWCADRVEGFGDRLAALEADQTVLAMAGVYNAIQWHGERMGYRTRVRWKDSYRKALGLPPNKEAE